MFRFDNDYIFKGKHSQYVKDLTDSFGKEESYKIFDRNLDVLILAPIIGFLNKRLGEIDNTDGINKTSILLAQLLRGREELLLSYRLIMLEDIEYEKNYEKRIEKAFKYSDFPIDEKDLEHFEKYILGGVEILHKEIIGKGKITDDYILNLVHFINEFELNNNNKENLEELENIEDLIEC